ncbi:MAG: cation:proton antiporter [Bacillota bacterium]
MISALGLLFLTGYLFSKLSQLIKLPPIIGMILAGVFLGENGFGLLSESILSISADLRKIALILILLRVGISLQLGELKTVGRSAICLSFLPAVCEIMGVVLLAPLFFSITTVEALLLGSVLAAVSPAVVMPRMLFFMENGYGTKKAIPQMIMAGASLDDIFVLIVFASCLTLAQGERIEAHMIFLEITSSILFGIVVGCICGFLVTHYFSWQVKRKQPLSDAVKIILLLGVSFSLVSLETLLADVVAMSGLLAVVSMGMVLGKRLLDTEKLPLKQRLTELWSGGEILLFTLVGAELQIAHIKEAGVVVVGFLFLILLFRTVGVVVSVTNTPLNLKEKAFCVVAYLPKATVQAAIGSVPLAMGLPVGELIFTISVMAIVVTAPLGAIGMDLLYRKCLVREEGF